MARRTAALKPQLNQIRTWAREGRTDAWIAYQLGTTSATVQEFRFEYGLDKGPGNPVEEPVTPELVVQTISFDSPPPLPPLEPETATAEPAEPSPTRRQRRSRPVEVDEQTLEVEVASESGAEPEHAAGSEADADRPKRRRRRGGRGAGAGAAADGAGPTEDARPEPVAAPGTPAPAAARRKTRTPASYKGSVVAGAVLVLDPAVTRSAAWRAHWADAPAFDVVIEDDQIVLRRRTAD